jgi:hypothetical protein
MEEDLTLESKITAIEVKLDAIYESVEKTRKYFLWAFIITLGAILIPLLLFPLVVPFFLSSISLPAGF